MYFYTRRNSNCTVAPHFYKLHLKYTMAKFKIKQHHTSWYLSEYNQLSLSTISALTGGPLMMVLNLCILFSLLFISIYMILSTRKTNQLIGIIFMLFSCNILVVTITGNPVGKHSPVISSEIRHYIDAVPHAFGILFSLTLVILAILYIHSRTHQTEERIDE